MTKARVISGFFDVWYIISFDDILQKYLKNKNMYGIMYIYYTVKRSAHS